MQASQKLKITTPANENQADSARKDTKIKADLIPLICLPREIAKRYLSIMGVKSVKLVLSEVEWIRGLR